MRLRRRIQLLFLPFLVLLAADVALDRYFVVQQDRALVRAGDLLDPGRLALGELQQALVAQEAGARGFIITGQERFLVPYEEGRAGTELLLEELGALFAGDEALTASVDRVRNRMTAWRQLGAEFEIAAKRAGRDEQAASLVATGTSMELFEAANTEINDLQDELRRQRNQIGARIDVLRSRITRLRVASLVLGAGFVAAAGWVLLVWITRPLRDLGAVVEAVADGQLDLSIPASGPPDIAELGQRVEAMRRRILAELGDASRARQALTNRGMIVLTLRDELASAEPQPPPGVRAAARCVPAEGVVAGDWFDFITVDGRTMVTALVDVSGHGSEAAVFALKTKELTMSALRLGLGPAAALAWLARQLADTGERFLTGVVLSVDASTGRLRYASAGHPPLLLTGPGGVVLLGPTGPLLGPLPGEWRDHEVEFPAGHRVVAYSDGVIEAPNCDGSELGVEGLADLVAGASGATPAELVDLCLEAVQERVVSSHDDLTLVVISNEGVVVGDHAGQVAVGEEVVSTSF